MADKSVQKKNPVQRIMESDAPVERKFERLAKGYAETPESEKATRQVYRLAMRKLLEGQPASKIERIRESKATSYEVGKQVLELAKQKVGAEKQDYKKKTEEYVEAGYLEETDEGYKKTLPPRISSKVKALRGARQEYESFIEKKKREGKLKENTEGELVWTGSKQGYKRFKAKEERLRGDISAKRGELDKELRAAEKKGYIKRTDEGIKFEGSKWKQLEGEREEAVSATEAYADIVSKLNTLAPQVNVAAQTFATKKQEEYQGKVESFLDEHVFVGSEKQKKFLENVSGEKFLETAKQFKRQGLFVSDDKVFDVEDYVYAPKTTKKQKQELEGAEGAEFWRLASKYKEQDLILSPTEVEERQRKAMQIKKEYDLSPVSSVKPSWANVYVSGMSGAARIAEEEARKQLYSQRSMAGDRLDVLVDVEGEKYGPKTGESFESWVERIPVSLRKEYGVQYHYKKYKRAKKKYEAMNWLQTNVDLKGEAQVIAGDVDVAQAFIHSSPLVSAKEGLRDVKVTTPEVSEFRVGGAKQKPPGERDITEIQPKKTIYKYETQRFLNKLKRAGATKEQLEKVEEKLKEGAKVSVSTPLIGATAKETVVPGETEEEKAVGRYFMAGEVETPLGTIEVDTERKEPKTIFGEAAQTFGEYQTKASEAIKDVTPDWPGKEFTEQVGETVIRSTPFAFITTPPFETARIKGQKAVEPYAEEITEAIHEVPSKRIGEALLGPAAYGPSPSKLESLEEFVGGGVKSVIPKDVPETFSPEQEIGQYAKGLYTGVRERPLTTGVSFGIGFTIPVAGWGARAGGGAIASRAGRLQEPLSKAGRFGMKAVGVGIGGAYGYSVGTRLQEAYREPTKDMTEELGAITSTEIVPMLAGGYAGLKVGEKISDISRIRGMKEIYTEEVVSKPVLRGEETFPGATRRLPSQKLVRYFQEEKFTPPQLRKEGVKVWHATAKEFPKETEVPYAQELRPSDIYGLYVSPEVSPHFMRAGGEYKGFGLDLPSISKPTALSIETKGVTRLPKRARTSIEKARDFMLEEAEAGRGYVTAAYELGKPEYEAVLPPGTPLERLGADYFFRYQGRKVPIMEYRAGDITKIDVTKPREIAKIGSGKYSAVGKIGYEYPRVKPSLITPYQFTGAGLSKIEPPEEMFVYEPSYTYEPSYVKPSAPISGVSKPSVKTYPSYDKTYSDSSSFIKSDFKSTQSKISKPIKPSYPSYPSKPSKIKRPTLSYPTIKPTKTPSYPKIKPTKLPSYITTKPTIKAPSYATLETSRLPSYTYEPSYKPPTYTFKPSYKSPIAPASTIKLSAAVV